MPLSALVYLNHMVAVVVVIVVAVEAVPFSLACHVRMRFPIAGNFELGLSAVCSRIFCPV